VTNEAETTAEISVHELAGICKEVDQEIESEFSGLFAQGRTWKKAEVYVSALSSPSLPGKSAWGLAEHAGYESPGPLQSLIGENKWSPDVMWERIAVGAGKLAEEDSRNDPLGIGIIFDETADVKRGKKTCGVGYQYAGCAGKVVNCTTWVMASLTGSTVRTWVAADLFLPEKDWFTGKGETGTARRKAAGVPGKVRFASKPQIALKQLRRMRKLGVRISHGGGDEVYGRYGKLLRDHERHGEAYAYFVPRNHRVKTRGRGPLRVDELPELDEARFEARSAGPGVKGPRYYEWAMIEVLPKHHYLLLRRPPEEERKRLEESASAAEAAEAGNAVAKAAPEPAERGGKSTGDRIKDEMITFCLCYVPPRSLIAPTLHNLVLMTGRRWGAEESNETGKGPIGWDENQFRKWESVNRHTALSGIAMLRSNLLLQRIDAARKDGGKLASPFPREQQTAPWRPDRDPAGTSRKYSVNDLMIPIGDSRVPSTADQGIPASIGFIRLTRNEVLRLAEIAQSDMSEEMKAFHLRWSKWRRRHQAISRWCHRITRMKTRPESGSEPPSPDPVTRRNVRPRQQPVVTPKAS
jgi:SRSO17 transposase